MVIFYSIMPPVELPNLGKRFVLLANLSEVEKIHTPCRGAHHSVLMIQGHIQHSRNKSLFRGWTVLST